MTQIRWLTGLLALAVAAMAAGPANAQVAVYDPANHLQNLLTASRALQQVNQQVRQLQNEAQMLLNQARNLQGLDFNALAQLRATLGESQQLLEQARGLAFEVQQARREFARLYPDGYGAEVPRSQIDRDAGERWTQAREALRTAVELQAQTVEHIAADETALADLVGRSQSAVGALQAAQATNQLLALQAQQSMQARQLQAAQGRASALEQARVVAVEAQSRELRRRFMSGRAAYTGEPVRLFGTGGE